MFLADLLLPLGCRTGDPRQPAFRLRGEARQIVRRRSRVYRTQTAREPPQLLLPQYLQTLDPAFVDVGHRDHIHSPLKSDGRRHCDAETLLKPASNSP